MTAIFSLEVEGLDELRKQLKKQKREFFEAMKVALAEEAKRLHGEVEPETPTASGQLLMSLARRGSAKPERGTIEHVVGYTDEKAAAVHEGVHWGRHFEDTDGFKWFEKVWNQFEPGATQRIIQRLRALTGGGGES